MNQNTKLKNYVNWVIKWRWFVLTGCLLVAMLVGIGLKNLGLSTNYRVFFSKDNPDLMEFDSLENIYTNNDNVFILLHPKKGDVFNSTTLKAVYEITEEAWQIPYSTRVDSLANFQHTWADGDNLVVEDLISDKNISNDDIEQVRGVSLNEPLIYRRLISRDSKTTGINIKIQLPRESSNEIPNVAAYSQNLRNKYVELYPDHEIKLVGIAMLNNAFSETPIRDMKFVMPLMFGIFVFALVGFLRSGLASGVTFLLILLSSITTLGIAGYLGKFLDPTSSSSPNIILTLAVADSIHILVTFLGALRDGKSRYDAIQESFSVNAKPVFLTSLTTAIGFLSLNFSDSPPFRLLGNLTAFGVLIAWLYSMTFLPAALAILPIKKPNRISLFNGFIDNLSNFVIRQHKSILVALSSVILILAFSISTLKVNDKYHEYFSKDLDIRKSMEFSQKNLSGVYSTSFSLDSGETNGVGNPIFLTKVDQFVTWLRKRPEVSHVASFSDTMKRLNKNMNNDDPSFYIIPDSQELGAQYLLLYEMSLPYGLDVNDQINIDKSSLRIDITYADVDLNIIEQSAEDASRWLQENGLSSMKKAKGTGPSLMFANITRRNINGMIIGTIIGFGLISLILMIALKSFKIGVLSLIPNILPATMAFGVWALLIGQVGFAVSVIASLSIGIIVDDTIHFLSKYHRARKELGYDTNKAIKYAFETVGLALIGTSFIIAAGFAMLGFSTFRVTSYMGILTSLAIICALITDFFLLPSILLILDKEKIGIKVKNIPKRISMKKLIYGGV
jgi:predicted RND superfamily exporter protein